MKFSDIVEGTAWHGSPHRFKTFRIGKLGTGEGHNAWGWGLYFASQREVAEYYRRTLAKRIKYDGKLIAEPGQLEAARTLLRFGGDKAEASSHHPDLAPAIGDLDYDKIKPVGGFVYEVEIPGDEKFLCWDTPFKQQSAFVKKALRALAPSYGRHLLQVLRGNDTGQVIYAHMGNHVRNERRIRTDEMRVVSRDLLGAGIVGIRYLDGFSRDGEGHTRNYVVFDDKLIKVVRVT